MGKRIFITGAAGFIGFHLAHAMRRRGDILIGCDNFNNYYDVALKQRRAQLLQEEGIDIIAMDICYLEGLDSIVREHRPSHIVHLAAQAGVRHSLIHPEQYLRSNLEGFLQILEVCRRYPDICLTFASSSSVYGTNTKQPFCESDPTDHPISLYGATKKSNEVLAHAYHHLYGIRMAGLRFFTVYGPWGRPDMAYYAFTRAILAGTVIDVYNEGKLWRDFTYVDDIVDGIIAAVDLAPSWEIFNLGSNRPEELLTLIGLIEARCGVQAKKRFLPMQPGDVLVTYADITKSANILSFCPKVSLQEGVDRFLDWYMRCDMGSS